MRNLNAKVKIINNVYYLIRNVFFLFILFTITESVFSQNMPVPENIQAALLPKVLKFNPKISQEKVVKMLIVYDNNSLNTKNEFIKELGKTMEIKAIQPNELEESIAGYDLVYFMPGIHEESSICKNYQVLSVTGISQYVEHGEISLGFGIQNNKPKILVNLTSLEQEGQSLSSDILRIATIFN